MHHQILLKLLITFQFPVYFKIIITDLLTRVSGEIIFTYGNCDFKAILQARAVFPDSGSPSNNIERSEVFSENLT